MTKITDSVESDYPHIYMLNGERYARTSPLHDCTVYVDDSGIGFYPNGDHWRRYSLCEGVGSYCRDEYLVSREVGLQLLKRAVESVCRRGDAKLNGYAGLPKKVAAAIRRALSG